MQIMVILAVDIAEITIAASGLGIEMHLGIMSAEKPSFNPFSPDFSTRGLAGVFTRMTDDK